MDAADVAVVLDIPVRAVWDRFENMVMDDGVAGFGIWCAAQVRSALLAMKPKPKPIPAKICPSCR
jgi:hypothetical protein